MLLAEIERKCPDKGKDSEDDNTSSGYIQRDYTISQQMFTDCNSLESEVGLVYSSSMKLNLTATSRMETLVWKFMFQSNYDLA